MSILPKWNGTKIPKFNNCLVCYLRPSLYFGCLSVTALTFNCVHSRRPHEMFFKRSNLFSFIGLILPIVMIAVGIYDSYSIITGDGDLTFVINESCIALLSGTLCIFANYKVTERSNHLKDLGDLIEHVNETQNLVLLDDLFAFKCWIFTWWAILSCCGLQVILTIRFVLVGDYTFQAVKTAVCDIYIILEGTVGVHFLLMIIVFMQIFHKLSKELKKLMLTKNVHERKHEYMVFDEEQYNFERSIKWLRKLYSSTFSSFKKVNNFMSQCFLFWWNGVVIISTVTHYLVIKSVIEGNWTNEYIIIIIKLYFGIVSITVYLGFMEALHRQVSQYLTNKNLYFFIASA